MRQVTVPAAAPFRGRWLPAALLWAISGIAVASPAFGAAAVRDRPNILLVMVDDLGWSDLPCYGNEFHRTPHIDRLARDGMRFTQAYASAPICAPTRAALLTGRSPARLHLTGQPSYFRDPPVRQFLHPEFRTSLPREIRTLGERLKAAGYVTACFGKLGLQDTAQRCGFDEHHHGPVDRLAQRCVAFLRRHRGRPCWLHLAPHEVHTPLAPKVDPEILARYRALLKPGEPRAKAQYAALVQQIDEAVGRVLREIDDRGLARRTLVVFTSDNGGYTAVTSNAPLAEGKASLYEGGIRVPLLVRLPGVVRPASTCDVPVITADLYPTLLELAGVEIDPNERLDGISLVPLLRQAAAVPRDTLYWHWPHYRRSLPSIRATPSSAVRHGAWKLIERFEDGRVELYNLKDDVGERHDLAGEMPQKARTLNEMLSAWRKSVDAQMPVPNPKHR